MNACVTMGREATKGRWISYDEVNDSQKKVQGGPSEENKPVLQWATFNFFLD